MVERGTGERGTAGRGTAGRGTTERRTAGRGQAGRFGGPFPRPKVTLARLTNSTCSSSADTFQIVVRVATHSQPIDKAVEVATHSQPIDKAVEVATHSQPIDKAVVVAAHSQPINEAVAVATRSQPIDKVVADAMHGQTINKAVAVAAHRHSSAMRARYASHSCLSRTHHSPAQRNAEIFFTPTHWLTQTEHFSSPEGDRLATRSCHTICTARGRMRRRRQALHCSYANAVDTSTDLTHVLQKPSQRTYTKCLQKHQCSSTCAPDWERLFSLAPPPQLQHAWRLQINAHPTFLTSWTPHEGSGATSAHCVQQRM
eukprot:365200-Chlamydomonas_euryale.AAC.11